MDGIGSKWFFFKYHYGHLGISKVMKISVQKVKDMDFILKKSTEKSLVGVALLLPTFPPL